MDPPISAFSSIALKPITSNTFWHFAFYAFVRGTREKYPTLLRVSNFCFFFFLSQANVWSFWEVISNRNESKNAEKLRKMKASQ